MNYLGESSQKISKIVHLIQTFASQTQVLAFNASVEASRAGETGLAFNVIAKEVQSLSQQSGAAAAEIQQVVTNIQLETNEVATAIALGMKQVEGGAHLVHTTRQSLNKISEASNKISQLVEAIAKAVAAQSQSSEIITQTMVDVGELTLKTATEVDLISSSSEQLLKVAQTLREEVGLFKVN